MLDAPNPLDTPLNGTKKAEWLKDFIEITEETGFFQPLGERHVAGFVDEGPILLVTFESIQGIQALSDTAQPMGWDFARALGWSHLAVVSDSDTWFRDGNIYGFFDRLIDDGFFEDFDRVVFYGAGPCGYAAAAYSVAAPGATVVAVQPQATLDPRVTEWDDRFVEMRRTSFTDRFGYAPDMLDAAKQGFVIYDPREDLDAMHAALFTRSNVTKLRMPNMGDALQSELIAMEILFPILQAAGEERLDETLFAELYRARREHPPYLRGLIARMDVADRPWLATMICRNVVARMKAPRIKRRLDALEKAAAEGAIRIPPKRH
ncbi:phosphoadenosine phosphosulfate reductase [Thalassovita aquimarina]|uniref:Phosphoadenosine phosphosulfate reductase n=1 Tax=Thalassovita aquimarina TaxID=2785917 RepID=A0ABS5HM04_9RHOB|nr:phosphoadenosine phosphosulfate reductase [Thalassovita aquimarina]MBR9649573.1 phosphoadenosine phosphosulfate reductase [Thalassovita aquimarina]